jgi:hypothetical protein
VKKRRGNSRKSGRGLGSTAPEPRRKEKRNHKSTKYGSRERKAEKLENSERDWRKKGTARG